MLMFGCDVHVPGLELYEEEPTDELRLQRLGEFKGFQQLREALADLDRRSKLEVRSKSAQFEFPVGSLATYRLSARERLAWSHHTGERSYAPVHSFPHRVIGSSETNVTLVPL